MPGRVQYLSHFKFRSLNTYFVGFFALILADMSLPLMRYSAELCVSAQFSSQRSSFYGWVFIEVFPPFISGCFASSMSCLRRFQSQRRDSLRSFQDILPAVGVACGVFNRNGEGMFFISFSNRCVSPSCRVDDRAVGCTGGSVAFDCVILITSIML